MTTYLTTYRIKILAMRNMAANFIYLPIKPLLCEYCNCARMHAISSKYEPNPKAELGANLKEAADMKEEDQKQYILTPTGSRTHPASDDIFFASYIQI